MKGDHQPDVYPTTAPPPYSGPLPGSSHAASMPYTDNPSQVTVVHAPKTTVTMNVQQVGPKAATMVCPSCGANVLSRVDHKSTSRTHIAALILCLCLCWPCMCIPYCMDSCKNADHYCPNCNAFLGSYKA